MTEEEIINNLNYFCDYEILYGGKICFTIGQLKGYQKSIQGILDLYNKEKAKNKKLELQDIPLLQGKIKVYEERIDKFLNIKLYACDIDKNVECSKENCIMNGGECDATTDETKVKYINLDDYVSKNKIREKNKFVKNHII